MNKKDLIDAVAKKASISKKAANDAIDTLITTITKSLKKGEKVTFVGFGTFTVRKRAARKARNPRTQQIIKVPAKKVPVFRPGSELRKAVK
jgi:DNA-binding protein HU-beta